MRQLKTLLAVCLGAAVISMTGCAATGKQQSASDYTQDAIITTKVKAAILNEPNLKVGEISVETFDRVVQLSGFVSSEDAAKRAVEVARETSGVKEVKNDMRVK
jgi:osmotically-inducible protein OsmY